MSLFEQLSLFRLPSTQSPELPRRRRQVLIGARVVDYELRQAAGRRLAMRIDERGLRVGAPKSLPLHAIERFVLDHGDWVLQKLDEYARQSRPRHLVIRQGVVVPVFGESMPVHIEAGNNRVCWQPDRLVLAARPDADLNALARRALQRRAFEYCGERSRQFAARLGRSQPRLALSSARTRWGSCSTTSGVRINWRLVHLPPRFADYVVAHELAHLVHMNHSARFWQQVEALFPDWQAVRDELKSLAATIPIV